MLGTFVNSSCDIKINLKIAQNCKTLITRKEGGAYNLKLLPELGIDRVRRCIFLTSFQEGLEGDRGSVRVQRCCLFQEGAHQKLFFQGIYSKFCKYDGKLYYSRYCQFSYVITGKLLATHSFLSLKYGDEKNTRSEMKGGLSWKKLWRGHEHDISSLTLEWETFF